MFEFDDPKKEITIDLYEEPIRAEDTTADVWKKALAAWEHRKPIKVKARRSLKHREAWSHKLLAIQAEDKKRIREERADTTEEEMPILWQDGYITEKGKEDRTALAKEILAETLVKIFGFKVGERIADDVDEKIEMIDWLEYTGLLEIAMVRVMAAQRPSPRQSLSSGS